MEYNSLDDSDCVRWVFIFHLNTLKAQFVAAYVMQNKLKILLAIHSGIFTTTHSTHSTHTRRYAIAGT